MDKIAQPLRADLARDTPSVLPASPAVAPTSPTIGSQQPGARKRPKRITKQQHHDNELMFLSLLLLTCSIVAGISAMMVMRPDDAIWLLSQISFQAIFLGAVVGLATHINGLPEGAPIDGRTATTRAVIGGLSGLITAKGLDGANFSAQIQIAGAGAAGAKGPEILDKLASKMMDKLP